MFFLVPFMVLNPSTVPVGGLNSMNASPISIEQGKVANDKTLNGPVLPAGINAAIQELFVKIEKDSLDQDFDSATKALDLLPKQKVEISYDDSAVAPQLKRAFLTAARGALQDWQNGINLNFNLLPAGQSKHPDIKISFSPVLRRPDGQSRPLTLATFFSTDPNAPRLDAVIGLKRDQPLVPTNDGEVRNEVGYLVGAYFGLGDLPFPGSYMNHVDVSSTRRAVAPTVEQSTVLKVLDAADTLRRVIPKHFPVLTAEPKCFVDPKKLGQIGELIQGTNASWKIQLTNTGTSPLTWQLVPDCSCFDVDQPTPLPAGGSILAGIRMDTRTYTGPTSKAIFVLTNDPSQPYITIPVSLNISPRFQFVTKPSETVLVDSNGDAKIKTSFLVSGTPIAISDAQIEGQKGSLVFTEKSDHHGYDFDCSIQGDTIPGRSMFALVLHTNDPVFPTIRHTFYLQRGILVTPDNLYTGRIAQSPQVFTIELSKPDRPFHIYSLTVDNPMFKVDQQSLQGGALHRVFLKYNGTGDIGRFSGSITIKTDQTDQKLIVIPFSGIIH